jgi:hypothetical protein
MKRKFQQISLSQPIVFFFLRQNVMPDSSIYLTIRRLSPTLTNGRQFIQYCAWRISSALQYDNDDFFSIRGKNPQYKTTTFLHIIITSFDTKTTFAVRFRIFIHNFTTGFSIRQQVFFHKFLLHIRCINIRGYSI